MKRIALIFSSALLLAGAAVAQDPQPRDKVRTFTFTQQLPLGSMPGMSWMQQDERVPIHDISFFSAEVASAGEVVTSAPYSATAITETTQVLSDGNKIVNTSSSFVARDSQGRTRRETTLNRIGTEQMDSSKVVFINDPITHTQYVLAPGHASKVVRTESSWGDGPIIIDIRGNEGHTIDLHGDEAHGAANMGYALKQKMIARRSPGEPSDSEGSKQIKHEDLGTQVIEGVSAQGKRETVTIPAGQIGNERPIDIVSETWFSPDLHTMVVRKHSDPRVGETAFRLTDIKRVEPDAALFQPPPGTKFKIEKVEPMLEFKREGPPKE